MADGDTVAEQFEGPFSESQFDLSLAVPFSPAKFKWLTGIALLPVALYLSALILLVLAFFTVAIKLFPSSGSAALVAAYIICIFVFLFIVMVFVRPFIFLGGGCKGGDLEPSSKLFLYAAPIIHKITQGKLKRVLVSSELVVELWFDRYEDFKSQKYTLVVGLPLLALLSEKEIYALIAKEAARYNNTHQKKYFCLNRYQLFWMHALANGYDEFSLQLSAWLKERRVVKSLLSPLLAVNNIVPKIFSSLYSLSDSISKVSLEHLEIYTDQYLIHVVGAQGFDPLLQHLVRIDQAFQLSIDKVLNGASVPANVVELIERSYRSTNIAAGQNIEMARSDKLNNWYFVPPPNIRHRKSLGFTAEALIVGDQPARCMVENFDDVALSISETFYQDYGAEVTEESREAENANEGRIEIALPSEIKLLKRVTSGLYRDEIVWEFPKADKFAHVPEEKLTPFLNKLVLSIRHNLPDLSRYVTLVDEYNKCQQRSHYAKWLVKDGSRERIPGEELDKVEFFIKDFDKAFEGKKEFYRKSYGVRVAAAVTLGKENKAYKSAIKIIQLLNTHGQIQDNLSDTRIKCETVKSLVARRSQGVSAHNNTISRFTRMMLKSIDAVEQVISGLPLSLLPEDCDPMKNKLELERMNGADYERLVCERFGELDAYYRAFNTALSAKLAQFMEAVERKKGIESVIIAQVKSSDAAE